jgi:hypothetical protein
VGHDDDELNLRLVGLFDLTEPPEKFFVQAEEFHTLLIGVAPPLGDLPPMVPKQDLPKLNSTPQGRFDYKNYLVGYTHDGSSLTLRASFD